MTYRFHTVIIAVIIICGIVLKWMSWDSLTMFSVNLNGSFHQMKYVLLQERVVSFVLDLKLTDPELDSRIIITHVILPNQLVNIAFEGWPSSVFLNSNGVAR